MSPSTRVSYEELRFSDPPSRDDQLFLVWLADRYVGKSGTPVMTFECDNRGVLLVPNDLIARVLQEADAKPIPSQAPSLLPISSEGVKQHAMS